MKSTISETIIKKLKDTNTRFFANDNISQHLDDNSRALLIDEVSDKF